MKRSVDSKVSISSFGIFLSQPQFFQERLFLAKAERDQAHCQITELREKETQKKDKIAKNSVPHPHKLKSFTINKLCDLLGLADDAHKQEWSHIRVCRSSLLTGLSHLFLDYGKGHDVRSAHRLDHQLEDTTLSQARETFQCSQSSLVLSH
jgi:hypothetical protein